MPEAPQIHEIAFPGHGALLPVWVGVHAESRTIDQHRHGFLEVVLVTRGSGRHHYLGSEQVLGPGDAFLVLPHHPHAYEVRDSLEVVNCLFLPEALGEDWPHVAGLGGIFYLLLGEPLARRPDAIPRILHLDPVQREAALGVLMRLHAAQESKDPGARLLLKAYLLEYLVLLGRLQPEAADVAPSGPDQHDALRQVLTYVEAHYDEDLCVQDIARRMHLSTEHFRRIFRKQTGVSPVEYINGVRVRRAAHLLATTEQPVTTVAANVGISDPSYFARLFRRHAGCSPSEYRQRADL